MKPFVLGIIVAIVLGVVGHFDYQDAKEQESTYCANVKAGIWFDSKEKYSLICKQSVDS